MIEVVAEPQPSKDWYPPFGRWIALVVVSGISALIIIEVTHNAWLDICDQFHEPPVTTLGIAVAAVATGFPFAFALWTRSRQVIIIAAAAATLEGLMWWWLFTPVGVC